MSNFRPKNEILKKLAIKKEPCFLSNRLSKLSKKRSFLVKNWKKSDFFGYFGKKVENIEKVIISNSPRFIGEGSPDFEFNYGFFEKSRKKYKIVNFRKKKIMKI